MGYDEFVNSVYAKYISEDNATVKFLEDAESDWKGTGWYWKINMKAGWNGPYKEQMEAIMALFGGKD